MAGEILLTNDGKLRLYQGGNLVLVPNGGIEELSACCCGDGDPGGGTECTCRRLFTGLNYIYQQDTIICAPLETLYSLYGPLYASGFTSSSNSEDACGDPGAHRCYEMYAEPGVGPVPEGYDCESTPILNELCLSCSDTGSMDCPTTVGAIEIARPCGWLIVTAGDGSCWVTCDGAETYAPTWTYIGRNQFRPININNCIRSAITAGTLDQVGDPEEVIPTGEDTVCENTVTGFCPWPGNQLRVTITVGGQSLQVFGSWRDGGIGDPGSNTTVLGGWFWKTDDPLILAAAWGALPNHRGDHGGGFRLECDSGTEGFGLFTFDASAGLLGWSDPAGETFTYSNPDKQWLIPYSATSYTITDSIDSDTFLGTGDPSPTLTIELQWLNL